jgi:hypothetical protein
MKIKNFFSLLPALLLFSSALAFGQGAPGPSNYPISQQTQAGAPSGTCPGTNVYNLNTSNGNVYSCPTPGGSWTLIGSGGGSSNFNLTNSTPATSSTPQSSPYAGWNGTWWGPLLASATDGWTLQDVPGTSTTMASGKSATASETSGVVTILGTGMTVFPNNQSGFLGVGAIVTFQGFTTLTWLNNVPVSLLTNTATSITFDDPSNHANQGSAAETGVTASAAISALTLEQLAGSAPVGQFQLVNPGVATATSVYTSPEFDFVTNNWNGSASVNIPWRIYSKGGTGDVLPTLIIDRVGSITGFSGGGGGIILGGTGTTAQSDPQLTFDHDNAGVLADDGQIGFEPSDGVTYNQVYEFFTVIANTAAGLTGNEGSVAGADVDLGANGNARTNVAGPNYGVVLGGIGATGLGHEIFSPASGSSANYNVYVGGEYNPGSGSSTFTDVYVAPVITGTSSGATTAFTVAPTITTTNLTGLNLIADFQSAPGTSQVNIDYHGDINTAVLKSAAGTALPTCNSTTKGSRNVVSDATAPTYLGTYTSGGAVVAPVFCNGTNWVTD